MYMYTYALMSGDDSLCDLLFHYSTIGRGAQEIRHIAQDFESISLKMHGFLATRLRLIVLC